ncbi:MAG: PDZ domain-containing protein [Verrucomicrobiales bacterium]
MNYSPYLHKLAAFTFAPAAIIATSFADEQVPSTASSPSSDDSRHVEIEIEPGGFLIESDGKVVELQSGRSSGGKKKMSINLDDLLGPQAGGLGEMISKLVQAHPDQAGKLAKSFMDGDLMKMIEGADSSSSFSDLFSAGIEAAPYFVGLVVDVPDDALLSQLDLNKGTALIVKEVVADSPAAKAGFQKYDVLIAKNGAAFASRDDLVTLVTEAGKAEKAVELIKISKGERQDVAIIPAKREKNAFGTAFFGPGVMVPAVESSEETQAEMKALREELDSQREILESILSKLSDKLE